MTADAIATIDGHRLAGGRDGRGDSQIGRRIDLVGRLVGKKRRNDVGDQHDRAHPACGGATPRDLRQDFGDDVFVRLVAADVRGHREPEDPGFGQVAQVVWMHTAKPFGLGCSHTQPVHQRIDICQHRFGGAGGV